MRILAVTFIILVPAAQADPGPLECHSMVVERREKAGADQWKCRPDHADVSCRKFEFLPNEAKGWKISDDAYGWIEKPRRGKDDSTIENRTVINRADMSFRRQSVVAFQNGDKHRWTWQGKCWPKGTAVQ